MPKLYFVGVDVGTSSARAALVSSDGKVVKQAVEPIKIWNPECDHFEQSSDNIWKAVCACVTAVIKGIPKEEIVAISFDATCSLVILGANGEPLSVSNSRNREQNVILWMDHRAKVEAEEINSTHHELLQFVGGQVSVEMEMPKLLWLKKNVYISTWTKLWRAFDLPDFLTWRSTGSDSRSLCTVVCKWNFDAKKMQWDETFFNRIGLEDLCSNDFEIIGKDIVAPGSPIGQGLSELAAFELGLLPGTKVGAALIDAHAGALGLFGCRAENRRMDESLKIDLESKLTLICGTSTCHMSLTRNPCHTPGVWGPYYGAILPQYYLNEGGQSATGLLLDHIIKTHPQYPHIQRKLEGNEHIYKYLNKLLVKMAEAKGMEDYCFLTQDLHVWPDYRGNRSPIADANLKGMITGISLSDDEESLAILYLAFVQALAYGTRHIIENLCQHKRSPFKTLLFCGGLSKNELYVQSHADICQISAVMPSEQEMVLVGAAMLAACAAKIYGSLEEVSNALGSDGKVLKPKNHTQVYHNRKYEVFLKMLDDQIKYRSIMES